MNVTVPKSVSVLMPVGSPIPDVTRDCLNRLFAATGWSQREGRGAMSVEYVRSFLAEYWHQKLQTEWALCIDADMVFDVWQACELVNRAQARGLKVLSAFYTQKMQGGTIPACDWNGERVLGIGGGIGEVNRIPGGFMVLHRSLLPLIGEGLTTTKFAVDGMTLVGKPYFFPMLKERPGKPAQWLQDDYALSERIKAAGVPLLMDTSIVVGHRGGYTYGLDDFPKRERLTTVKLTLTED